jgi:hypothetical protein
MWMKTERILEATKPNGPRNHFDSEMIGRVPGESSEGHKIAKQTHFQRGV